MGPTTSDFRSHQSPGDGDTIAGYVSLTTGSVRSEEAPKSVARGMPRYPIGTILIARLAVDLRYRRQRLGSRLGE